MSNGFGSISDNCVSNVTVGHVVTFSDNDTAHDQQHQQMNGGGYGDGRSCVEDGESPTNVRGGDGEFGGFI